MIGLFLAPARGKKDAYGHFCKTVLDNVPIELRGEHADKALESTTSVWGLTSSIESTWEGVEEGDWMLFYTRENEYNHAARVAARENIPELGDAIREEVLDDASDQRDWDFLLYLKNLVSVSVSGDEVANLLDYGNRFPVRFIRVTGELRETLKTEYGELDGFINAIRE